jgi:Heterokaryon incompatibility protein (HET)
MSDPLTPYKYRSFRLDHNGNSTIRVMLLTPSKNVDDFLTCRIVHKTLHDCSSYHALSYTWGEPVFSKTLVVDKSMRIPITENLDFALRKLRLDGIRALWVDAICINQQDVQERAQQVRLMGRIFSQAKSVIIWTGLDNASRDGWHCLECCE